MRAATPGTILILAATILLVLVTCSAPVIKSISFLTATVGGSGSEKGDKITLGCLGYCLGDKCVGPTIGYSFDPTQLLGVATSVEGYNVNSSKYTTAVIKALTYTLVLHPIALAACALTLLFGLLAHCGDMSLRCLNSVFASIASLITLIAVGCDFALFIIAKKRIDDISGASASLGSALWLTLIAWILIVLSSFTFCCSCCGTGGSGRKNRTRDEYDDDAWKGGRKGGNYQDQMRMDALDAEADRRRRNNKSDLPKFATYETEHVESLPLKQDYEDPAGAAGFAANGVGVRGAQGYRGNQYNNYADPGYVEPNYMAQGYGEHDYGHQYTPSSEQAGYNYGYADGGPDHRGGESYIPGVGPGAHRGDTAAAVYYDGSQGPMSPSSRAATQYPNEFNDNASAYSYGTHRAPSMTSNVSRGQTGDGYNYHPQEAPPVPAMPSAIPAPINHRQPTMQNYEYSNAGHEQYPSTMQGHAVDYSGATFGGGGGPSSTPYDAIQQATAAATRSRALPTPSAGSDRRQSGIIYSPTSPGASLGGSGGGAAAVGKSGDDGFGLAVLQAGAAARAVGGGGATSSSGQNRQRYDDVEQQVTSPISYNDQSRESWGSPTRSRPLPSAPANYNNHHGRDYSEEAIQSQPPGYESDSEAINRSNGHQYSQHQHYPHEKR